MILLGQYRTCEYLQGKIPIKQLIQTNETDRQPDRQRQTHRENKMNWLSAGTLAEDASTRFN